MAKIVKNKKKNPVKSLRIGVVVSRFNDFVSKLLLDGCLRELNHLGVQEKAITVVWVPGAYEIPLVALKLAKNKSIDGVICLGAVIRGETAHFDLVAQGAAQGIMHVNMTTEKPVIFEVLATQTVDQAYKRAGRGGTNKGITAARAVVDMIHLMKHLK